MLNLAIFVAVFANVSVSPAIILGGAARIPSIRIHHSLNSTPPRPPWRSRSFYFLYSAKSQTFMLPFL